MMAGQEFIVYPLDFEGSKTEPCIRMLGADPGAQAGDVIVVRALSGVESFRRIIERIEPCGNPNIVKLWLASGFAAQVTTAERTSIKTGEPQSMTTTDTAPAPNRCDHHVAPPVTLSDTVVDAMAATLWRNASGLIEVREVGQRLSPKRRAKTAFADLPGYLQDDLRDVSRIMLAVAVDAIDPMANPATQFERIARMHTELQTASLSDAGHA